MTKLVLYLAALASVPLLLGSVPEAPAALPLDQQIRNASGAVQQADTACDATLEQLEVRARGVAAAVGGLESALLFHSSAERYANQTDALMHKARRLSELASELAARPRWTPGGQTLRK